MLYKLKFLIKLLQISLLELQNKVQDKGKQKGQLVLMIE